MGAFAPSPLITAEIEPPRLDEIVRPVLGGHGARRPSLSRVSLRRPDADRRRPEGDRVQRALRRSRGAGRPADARRRSVVAARRGGDRRAAVAARAISRRAARRCRARGGRLSRGAGNGQGDHRSRRASRVPGALVFHAGTAQREGRLVTAGGRVLTVVGRGTTYQRRDRHRRTQPHRRFTSTACSIRRDIGRKALSRVKYSVVTFGCRVNQADSLVIEGELRARGAVCASPEEADLVVVNTCSVTATADQGARQTIRRIARDNPDVRIVVTGCYATRRPDELRELPNVDSRRLQSATRTTCSRRSRSAIPRRLRRRALRRRRRPLRCARAGRRRPHRVDAARADRLRGALQLLHHPDDARAEPLAPVDADRDVSSRTSSPGYKEIAITGVHLGSYGRDLGDGIDADGARARLAEWARDVLFRISSLEPMDCTQEIVDLVAELAAARAALPSAAPARRGRHAACDATAVHRGVVPAPRRTDPRDHAARVDRVRCHRRISRRER